MPIAQSLSLRRCRCVRPDRTLASAVIEPQSQPDIRSSDLDSISVTLQVGEPVGADASLALHASCGTSRLGHPLRIIPEQKLSLFMALQRRLLFGGFPDSSELERALSLLEASFTHKLFLTGSAAVTAGKGVAGWDSASPAFAEMLSRLRAAGRFPTARPAAIAGPTAADFSSAAARVAGDGAPHGIAAAGPAVGAAAAPRADTPWRSTAELACCAALEAATPFILEELQRVVMMSDRDGGGGEGAEGAGGGGGKATWDAADYTAIAPDWSVLHLWKGGVWQQDAEALMPQTVALLRAEEAAGRLRLNPLQNVACGVARQPSGSGIAPHCDGNVLGLTAHLGLLIPEGGRTWIEVGGDRRVWRAGRVLLFDTTFTHSTRNDSPDDRCDT